MSDLFNSYCVGDEGDPPPNTEAMEVSTIPLPPGVEDTNFNKDEGFWSRRKSPILESASVGKDVVEALETSLEAKLKNLEENFFQELATSSHNLREGLLNSVAETIASNGLSVKEEFSAQISEIERSVTQGQVDLLRGTMKDLLKPVQSQLDNIEAKVASALLEIKMMRGASPSFAPVVTNMGQPSVDLTLGPAPDFAVPKMALSYLRFIISGQYPAAKIPAHSGPWYQDICSKLGWGNEPHGDVPQDCYKQLMINMENKEKEVQECRNTAKIHSPLKNWVALFRAQVAYHNASVLRRAGRAVLYGIECGLPPTTPPHAKTRKKNGRETSRPPMPFTSRELQILSEGEAYKDVVQSVKLGWGSLHSDNFSAVKVGLFWFQVVCGAP